MAKTKKKSEEVSNRGAPQKSERELINQYHWRNEQWKRICEEAALRNISPFAFQRIMGDWFFTALDTGRADVTASQIFDDKLAVMRDAEGGDER